jgi:alkylhydroperoxidase family enzyme
MERSPVEASFRARRLPQQGPGAERTDRAREIPVPAPANRHYTSQQPRPRPPRCGAALAWREAVTQISVDHVPDAVYEEARRFFNEKELVSLTAAVVAIYGWNRFAISFRAEVGTYQPATAARA